MRMMLKITAAAVLGSAVAVSPVFAQDADRDDRTTVVDTDEDGFDMGWLGLLGLIGLAGLRRKPEVVHHVDRDPRPGAPR